MKIAQMLRYGLGMSNLAPLFRALCSAQPKFRFKFPNIPNQTSSLLKFPWMESITPTIGWLMASLTLLWSMCSLSSYRRKETPKLQSKGSGLSTLAKTSSNQRLSLALAKISYATEFLLVNHPPLLSTKIQCRPPDKPILLLNIATQPKSALIQLQSKFQFITQRTQRMEFSFITFTILNSKPSTARAAHATSKSPYKSRRTSSGKTTTGPCLPNMLISPANSQTGKRQSSRKAEWIPFRWANSTCPVKNNHQCLIMLSAHRLSSRKVAPIKCLFQQTVLTISAKASPSPSQTRLMFTVLHPKVVQRMALDV